MKTLQKLTLLTSMLVLFTVIPAVAQLNNALKFEAPFPFYAGNAELPGGTYIVTQADANGDLLKIQSADGTHSIIVGYLPAHSETRASSGEITFNRYGQTEFLNLISLQGQHFQMQIPPSQAEQNAAKAAAAEKHTLSATKGQ
jgi:hypothetical protein